jgi:hypothetical protein
VTQFEHQTLEWCHPEWPLGREGSGVDSTAHLARSNSVGARRILRD